MFSGMSMLKMKLKSKIILFNIFLNKKLFIKTLIHLHVEHTLHFLLEFRPWYSIHLEK
jgi:hypothetical protein